MAILRSRALGNAVHAIANPNVQRAIQEWESHVVQAREAGRREGLEEAKGRMAEADKRAATAEARAEEKQKARHAEVLSRLDPLITSLAGAVTRLEPLEKQIVQEAEGQSVRLALNIAAAILRKSIDSDPHWMASVVKGALMRMCDRRRVTIRLHPLDAEALQSRVRELTAPIPGLENLEVVSDMQLTRGACTLISQGTRLDASLSGCWDRLAGELLELTPASDCTQTTMLMPSDATQTNAPVPADKVQGTP
jgi:flagellar assembly protein FliH